MLGAAFQGRGVGPEALRLAIRKVGFRDVGITRQSARTPEGIREDSLLLELLRDELRE